MKRTQIRSIKERIKTGIELLKYQCFKTEWKFIKIHIGIILQYIFPYMLRHKQPSAGDQLQGKLHDMY